MDEKYENRSEETKGEHVDQNQGKAVITGVHSETSESEVTQLLKESINEVGMDIEVQESSVPQNRSHTRLSTSRMTEKEINSSGQRMC